MHINPVKNITLAASYYNNNQDARISGIYCNSCNQQISFNGMKLNMAKDFAKYSLGFFSKTKLIEDDARRIFACQSIIYGATMLATGSAALLANTMIGDTIVLTTITGSMCTRLGGCYGLSINSIKQLKANALSIMGGKLVGTLAASVAVKAIPGVGNTANAVITYALHELCGQVYAAYLEKAYQNGNISKGGTLNFSQKDFEELFMKYFEKLNQGKMQEIIAKLENILKLKR